MKEVNIISKVVGREGTGKPTTGRDSQGAVDLSAYLLKQIWDSAFELKEKDGVQYLFGKIPLVLQYGMTMYEDAEGLDLPSIYDGLPIDSDTIYWEEVVKEDGTVSKVLKSKGGGSGSIEFPLSWSGFSTGTYDGSTAQTIVIPNNTNQLVNGAGFIKSSDLSGYATETWVEDYFLPLTGGTLTGDLRLKSSSSNYGRSLYFGDSSYCYLKEDSDDHLYVYASNGIDFEMGSSKYFGVEGAGIKVNGAWITYNSSGGYWEINGDVIVNGLITMGG